MAKKRKEKDRKKNIYFRAHRGNPKLSYVGGRLQKEVREIVSPGCTKTTLAFSFHSQGVNLKLLRGGKSEQGERRKRRSPPHSLFFISVFIFYPRVQCVYPKTRVARTAPKFVHVCVQFEVNVVRPKFSLSPPWKIGP